MVEFYVVPAPPLPTPTGTSASCTDMMMNGDETDVDCGGPCDLKCGNGYRCIRNTDCMSNTVSGS
jgi:hypothetical protein